MSDSPFSPYDPHALDITEFIDEMLETPQDDEAPHDEKSLRELLESLPRPTYVGDLPFYETALAPFAPLIIRMGDRTMDMDWATGQPLPQLLFQLIAASFSSKWWLDFSPTRSSDVYPEPSDFLDLPSFLKQTTISYRTEETTRCPPRLLISVSSDNAKMRKAVDDLFLFQLYSALMTYLQEQFAIHLLVEEEKNGLNDRNPLELELMRLRGELEDASPELSLIETKRARNLQRYRGLRRWYRQNCPHLPPESDED